MDFDTIFPDLPPGVARHQMETLFAALPHPIPNTSENRAIRDEAALAAIAGLQPVGVLEFMMAIQVVVTEATAGDCARRAVELAADIKLADGFRRQSDSMMRLMRDSLRDLQRQQAKRKKQEAKGQPAPVARIGPLLRDVSLPAAAMPPRPANTPAAEEARRQRAARIRALDLRVIETPPTRH